MISRAMASLYARGLATYGGYWRRADELGDLGADFGRRGIERRCAAAAQSGDATARAFLGFWRADLDPLRADPGQEPAVLGGYGVLRHQPLRLAGGAVQSARQHGLSHAVSGVYRGGGRLGVMVG